MKWSVLRIPLIMIILMIGSSFIGTVYAAENSESVNAAEPEKVGNSSTHSIMGKAGNGNDENPGEWYTGETPSDVDENDPILLFIAGMNGKAQDWWEDNDMYNTAYEAGYQTSFLQLYDAGGASADMWDNGELLAEKIIEISDHFGGKQITIIAHSKGGVDAQTALTYYDAWPYVDNVITLSSPHHGTPLADLANSFWAGWLADLLGMQGEGTYVMQTGYMEDFRSRTAGEPEAGKANYYTLGGTSWGSAFSATWFGGVYLSPYGSNDGVVTLASSALPEGEQIASGDWDHSSIRTGITFPEFQGYLQGNQQQGKSQLGKRTVAKNDLPSNRFVSGGPLEREVKETIHIPIEQHVDQVTLNLIAAQDLTDVSLINPAGEAVEHRVHTVQTNEAYFPGARHYSITLDQPEAGEWEFDLLSAADNAYLLMTDFETEADNGLTMHLNKKVSDQSQKLQLAYQLDVDGEKINEESLTATYHVVDSSHPENTDTWYVTERESLSQHISLDQSDTIYNITIDLEGKTKAGDRFQRTFIDSIYTGKSLSDTDSMQ